MEDTTRRSNDDALYTLWLVRNSIRVRPIVVGNLNDCRVYTAFLLDVAGWGSERLGIQEHKTWRWV